MQSTFFSIYLFIRLHKCSTFFFVKSNLQKRCGARIFAIYEVDGKQQFFTSGLGRWLMMM
jgi:hypothetical protein